LGLRYLLRQQAKDAEAGFLTKSRKTEAFGTMDERNRVAT
tara:strand:+ start:3317 stop:3436 length:120 start_codon:yes stop_codon:yes gene_type:complete